MALPPDSGETFLREVDENLRRDQARDFAKRYGAWLIAALVLFLVAVGGWIYWRNHQQRQAATQSEEYYAVVRDIGTGKDKNADQKLQELSQSHADAMRATAMFAQASVALQNNNRTAAAAKFGEIANDKGLPDAYRDLATLRQTAVEFDTLKPEQVIARVQPMTKAGNPWFGSAGELTAMALLKQGKKTEAGRMFAAIAADKQVPESIRGRAVQIAGTLGVDASASAPTSELQGQ